MLDGIVECHMWLMKLHASLECVRHRLASEARPLGAVLLAPCMQIEHDIVVEQRQF